MGSIGGTIISTGHGENEKEAIMAETELTDADVLNIRLLVIESVLRQLVAGVVLQSGFIDADCETIEAIYREMCPDWSALRLTEFVDTFRNQVIHLSRL
jgi:hypothetical protein